MSHRVDTPELPSLVTVAAVNFDSVPGDTAATLAKMERFVRDAARQGTDLVVFPELALNPYGKCEDCATHHTPCAWHLAHA